MFFEMFQTCVDDLLHTEHFAAEQVSDIVDVSISICKTDINVCKTNIYRPCEIVQTLVINEYPDQHGDRWESGCSKRRHQLFVSNHSFTSVSERRKLLILR
jgi:hypothetical protein